MDLIVSSTHLINWGSLSGPNITRAIIEIMKSSKKPIENIIGYLYLLLLLVLRLQLFWILWMLIQDLNQYFLIWKYRKSILWLQEWLRFAKCLCRQNPLIISSIFFLHDLIFLLVSLVQAKPHRKEYFSQIIIPLSETRGLQIHALCYQDHFPRKLPLILVTPL